MAVHARRYPVAPERLAPPWPRIVPGDCRPAVSPSAKRDPAQERPPPSRSSSTAEPQPGGRRPDSTAPSRRPDGPAVAREGVPRDAAAALALALPGRRRGDVEQDQVQGAAAAAGLAGQPAPHPGLGAAVVDDDARRRSAARGAARRSGRAGPAGGRRRTAGSRASAASQRSRVSCESMPARRSAARRISVDLPLPGSPETTTRSPAAKTQAARAAPGRARAGRAATGAACRAVCRDGRRPGCAGSATPDRRRVRRRSAATSSPSPCRVSPSPCPQSVKKR